MQLRRDPSVRVIVGTLAVTAFAAVTVGLLQIGETTPDVACGGAQADAARLVACLRPAMAHISTPIGFGSGVLLNNGYVITNSHVVNPFNAVSVTIGDGDAIAAVPVVGVAPLEDIAVVGPVKGQGRGIALDASSVHVGDDVFLVGFPLDFSELPEPTITQGILSRVRSLPVFGLTYLESDAAIGHGQSGGALVDGAGRLLGISGLSIESFALSLSAADVKAAVERILGEEQHHPGPFAINGGDKNASFTLENGEDFKVGVAPADKDRELDLVVSGVRQPFVSFLPQQTGTRPDTRDLNFFGEPVDPTNGHFKYDLPADTMLFVVIGNDFSGRTADVKVSSNIALSVLGPATGNEKKDTTIKFGDSITRPLDLFGSPDTFKILLHENEVVDIYVGSPSDDMDFVLHPPYGLDRPLEVTDSGEGLFGLDAHAHYKAPRTGTYTIEVTAFSPVPTAYVIKVTKLDG